MNSDNESAPQMSRPRLPGRGYVLIGVAAVVLACGAGWYLMHRSAVATLPASVISASDVVLYHPKKSVAGLRFDQQDIDTDSDTTITYFENTKGRIVLTQQPKPKDTDLGQIDSAETYLTPIGTAYILKGERERIQMIVDTNSTWILVSADDAVGLQAVKDFVGSLALATK